MSKTIEERIKEAEAKVERCEATVDNAQAELDAAESDLEEAEAELDALEEERDAPGRAAEQARMAALVAERTGPQRPIGDRVVRTVCSVSEIPSRYATTMHDGKLRGPVGVDGSKWASNGHWMIRVDSNDGLIEVPQTAETSIGPIGSPVVRDDVPVLSGSIHARTFGKVHAMLDYTTLVEDLFPGVEWHVRPGPLEPVQALVNGQVVAIVMPMRATP